MRITLRSFNHVWAAILHFDRVLKPYNLRVVNHLADPREGAVQIFVNAQHFDEVQLVTKLSYDFFNDAILAINTTSGELPPHSAAATP